MRVGAGGMIRHQNGCAAIGRFQPVEGFGVDIDMRDSGGEAHEEREEEFDASDDEAVVFWGFKV